MEHQRFAIYYAPRPSALAEATAAWLGWDCQAGKPCGPARGMPAFPAEVTLAPRKYGFHGTLKAPFRLAPGESRARLSDAVANLAARLPPVVLPGMSLRQIGGFLALTPDGEDATLSTLAARVVMDLEPFRAPLTTAEIAKRRPERLTQGQRAHLARWGYPYVLDAFQFHLTLTGDLPPDQARSVAKALTAWLEPLVPRPFAIEDLCLFGEAGDGQFHLLSRHALTG